MGVVTGYIHCSTLDAHPQKFYYFYTKTIETLSGFPSLRERNLDFTFHFTIMMTLFSSGSSKNQGIANTQ